MKRRTIGTNSNVLEAAVRGFPDPVYGGYMLLLAALVNRIVLDAASRKKGSTASAGDLELADCVIRRMGGEPARCLDGLKPVRYPARQIEFPEADPRRVTPRRASQVVRFYNVRTGVVTAGVL